MVHHLNLWPDLFLLVVSLSLLSVILYWAWRSPLCRSTTARLLLVGACLAIAGFETLDILQSIWMVLKGAANLSSEATGYGRTFQRGETVLIPADNEKDLAEIPDNVKRGLKLIPVNTAAEVLLHALAGPLTPVTWVEDADQPAVIPAGGEERSGVLTH